MKIHVIQHASFEGPGYITKWAEQNNHSISTTHLYLKEKLPNLNNLDFLIVLGGPYSANDVDKIEWLEYGLSFIKDAIEEGKAVLGFCLGSQLVAKALNSKVYPGKSPEIGWFPIMFNKHKIPTELREIFPEYITSFLWHGETFDIPKEAEGFASTPATPNQAFIYRDRVIGLQFHPETTVYSIEAFIENLGNAIQEGRYIQPVEAIRKGSAHIVENNKLIGKLLSYLCCRIS